MLKYDKKDNSGFTLIELLVALAIFTSLSSFLIVNYRHNDKARMLNNQAQEAIAGLQRVQNMALTGEEVDSKIPLSYRFSISDCASDCHYELIAVFSDVEENIEFFTRSLESVTINTGSADELSVDFLPPRGKMTIAPSNPAVAGFEIRNDEAIYCIELNTVSGRIGQISGPCSDLL